MEDDEDYCVTCDHSPCTCDHDYELDREWREEVWG